MGNCTLPGWEVSGDFCDALTRPMVSGLLSGDGGQGVGSALFALPQRLRGVHQRRCSPVERIVSSSDLRCKHIDDKPIRLSDLQMPVASCSLKLIHSLKDPFINKYNHPVLRRRPVGLS
jgi:hypothetical protein